MRLLAAGQLTSYEITLGKVPSLNTFYSGKHWLVRKRHKDNFVAEALAQLEKYDCVPITDVRVVARVNYKYDVDNSIMAIKFGLDALKVYGAIVDDSRKYVSQIKILYDPTIESNTAKIIFEGVS